MSISKNIINEYNEHIVEIRNLAKELSSFFLNLPLTFPRIQTIEWRIKEIESIIEKSKRKKIIQLNEIRDIIGFRIIVDNNADIQELDKVIKSEFEIAEISFPQEKTANLHYLIVPSKNNPNNYSVEIQVQTLEIHAYLKLQHEFYYENQIKEPSDIIENKINSLENKIKKFEEILERLNPHEKLDIHPVLKKNSFLLYPNANKVYSEVQIGMGKEFQIDFLVQKSDGEYLLVEIENSKHNLFTKSGDFSASVNHAVKQVEDWQEWLEDNISSVQKKYPGMISPEGLVIIGRSTNLSDKNLRSLKRRNINTRGRIKIITYDDLLISAKGYVKSIKENLK